MSMLKIAGFAVIGLVTVLVMRKMKDEYASFASLVLCIGMTVSAVGTLSPVIEYLDTLGSQTDSGEMFSLMFKSCGIAVITTLASSLCRDAGESSLAVKTELCGKSMILAMALPLLRQVFDSALQILGQ